MKEKWFTGRFSHIYVEKRIQDLPRTREILRHFPGSRVILIDYYKDVFNRRGQDVILQHDHQNLILAGAKERNVYPGAPVCQDFGNAHFYYTSCAMNCLYDCEYCYLKGMYPSGNLVVFIELEKIMQEVESLLEEFPVYLCVSYDTDLLAMEDIVHYVQAWAEFTAVHPDLSVEVRTKCARRIARDPERSAMGGTDACAAGEKISRKSSLPQNGASEDARNRMIYAYTISPDEIIRKYEHGTALLRERLAAAAEGIREGYSIRLCFDPMIYVPGWRNIYLRMLEETAAAVPLDKVRDFSVGSFRISDTYLKNMRKRLPDSPVVQFPFALARGYYHYPRALEDEMETTVISWLQEQVPGAAVFRWE